MYKEDRDVMREKTFQMLERKPDEVEVVQYIRPNGKKNLVYATVGLDYAEKAKGLVFSAERLPDDGVVVCGRRADQSEEDEISMFAENGPGDNSPTNVLKKLIDRLREEKEKT